MSKVHDSAEQEIKLANPVNGRKCHLCGKPISGLHSFVPVNGGRKEFCGRDCLAHYMTSGIYGLISVITDQKPFVSDPYDRQQEIAIDKCHVSDQEYQRYERNR